MPALALAIFCLVLAIAAASDLASRRIPNALPLALALGAVVFAWPVGDNGWIDCAVSGLLTAALAAGLYLCGLLGGGDVKLLAAAALWIPLPTLPYFVFALGLAGALQAGFTLAFRRARSPGLAVRGQEMPYGLSIAAAGLAWAIFRGGA
jgi:prepilin peptidase CpaA